MQSCSPERGPHEPLTSLIFPAYNPGALVERTWREVERFVRQAPRLVGGPVRVRWLYRWDAGTTGRPDARCRRPHSHSHVHAQPGERVRGPFWAAGSAGSVAALHRCGPGLWPGRCASAGANPVGWGGSGRWFADAPREPGRNSRQLAGLCLPALSSEAWSSASWPDDCCR